jgi:ribonuclease P protein component
LSLRGVAGEALVVRLRRRSEFLAAARGPRAPSHAFVLQGNARPEAERAGTIGLGFTVTKKIGNAVIRNRARRRLREAARAILPGPARPGHDYVVVARAGALTRPFTLLQGDLAAAFAQIGRRLGRPRP